MNVRVEQPAPCRRELHIEVPAERIRSVFEDVVGAYAKAARIPGFRPGRAPRELIRRRFHKDILSDVKERVIPAAYQEALQQEKLVPLTVLDVKERDLVEDQAFSFTVVIDVPPAFELPVYKGIKVPAKPAAVTDEDVDRVIERIRLENGRYEDVSDRSVREGDLVQIDYNATLDGQALETAVPQAKGLGEGRDFWYMASSEYGFIPGLHTALIGAKPGEARSVEVTFPADFAEKAVAGKSARYEVSVKGLRERKPVELDAEFLKGVGVESVEALRERIRQDLKSMHEGGEMRRQQNEVAKHLLATVQLDLPDSVLQEQTRREVYDMVRDTQERGASATDIETRKEELFDTAARTASDKVKLRFILRRIAAEEKILVTPQELEAHLASLARSWNMPLERVRAELEKNDSINRVREDVLFSKTLSWLRDQADTAA